MSDTNRALLQQLQYSSFWTQITSCKNMFVVDELVWMEKLMLVTVIFILNGITITEMSAQFLKVAEAHPEAVSAHAEHLWHLWGKMLFLHTFKKNWCANLAPRPISWLFNAERSLNDVVWVFSGYSWLCFRHAVQNLVGSAKTCSSSSAGSVCPHPYSYHPKEIWAFSHWEEIF